MSIEDKLVVKIVYKNRSVIIKTRYDTFKEIIWYPKKWRGINIISMTECMNLVSQALDIDLITSKDVHYYDIGHWK